MPSEQEAIYKKYHFGVERIMQGEKYENPAYIIRLAVGNWVESRTIRANSGNLKNNIEMAKKELADLYEIFEYSFPGLTPLEAQKRPAVGHANTEAPLLPSPNMIETRKWFTS